MSNSVDDLMAEGHHESIDHPIVHQATGILMARRGTTIVEAMTALCKAAVTMGIDVPQLADTIVRSTPGRSKRK